MLSPIAQSQEDSWRCPRGRPSSSSLTAVSRPASDAARGSRNTFVTWSDFYARTTAAAVPPRDPTRLRGSGCSTRFGGGVPASVLARACSRELNWSARFRGAAQRLRCSSAATPRRAAVPGRRLSGLEVVPKHHPSRVNVKRTGSPRPSSARASNRSSPRATCLSWHTEPRTRCRPGALRRTGSSAASASR